MNGNTNLNFDVDELIQLNSEVVNSKDGIESVFSKIRNGLEELKSNIKGTQVNNLISTITENIITIDAKMDVSFEQLTTFLNGQMKSYASTYEGALAILNSALNFIDTTFSTGTADTGLKTVGNTAGMTF